MVVLKGLELQEAWLPLFQELLQDFKAKYSMKLQLV
jgi:hypothetical protein